MPGSNETWIQRYSMELNMNEQKIHRIAEMIADDVEAEAGPKVGPVQKAVPVAVGVSAKVARGLLAVPKSGIYRFIHEAAGNVFRAGKEANYESMNMRNQVDVNIYGLVADECSEIYKRLINLEKEVEKALEHQEQIRKNIEG